MPRYPQEQREQTRGRILAAAAQTSLEGGLGSVSVQSVMRRAGLTHGGFYAHFESREALLQEALRSAARHKLDTLLAHAQTQSFPLEAFVRGYLSRLHRDDPAGGCLLPGLSAEAARAGDDVRAVLDISFQVFCETVASLGPWLSTAQVQALVSGMVGAVMLSRTLSDRTQSDALLLNVRQTLLALARPPEHTG
ncbi:TetR/AcrR family transcriptional regulator (plasmid) [Deinococcus sp. KNUC1210]|uniref:TetR/AcrR family transcriptional regulator n=1 Tax=Deinococcus sp. KNUC1210 TaxID=2917691 RepID=UPI001EF0D9B6|nr:TetR/AcrR family transcriptional regulator [Deinococcus sp. KNUC1210]ULH17267.1 TetR/AcrR family transcriptional regulator [Deinococcus sp. KNUC1210]